MVQGSSIKLRIDNPYMIHWIAPTSLDPCIAILEYLAENMNIDKSRWLKYLFYKLESRYDFVPKASTE